MTRPGLESRCIPRHRSEIAIVQPINNPLLLTEPSIALPIVLTERVFAQRQGLGLLAWQAVVALDEAAADEEDIADFDVAALRRRADVDALVFAAVVELFVAYGVVFVGVVAEGVSFGGAVG